MPRALLILAQSSSDQRTGAAWAKISAARPAMIRMGPLNHVALTVSDRKRSAAFYGEYFGLTLQVHNDEHLLILGSPYGSLLALSAKVQCQPSYRASTTSASNSQTQTRFDKRASSCGRPACPKRSGKTTVPWPGYCFGRRQEPSLTL
jgi:Glyoxalase/Bleomycin resistance protein/Dioxygenase superfamily